MYLSKRHEGPQHPSLYRYEPSAVAAIVCLCLFALATGVHCYYAYRYRIKFMIACAIGCSFEVIGFAARAASCQNTGALIPYIVQDLFVLLAPILFAATIYMTLGRVIRCLEANEYSMLRLSRLTKTFVISDVVCFLVQANGGSLQALRNPSLTKIGRWSVICGLCLQIVIFCWFIVVAAVFHIRVNSRPTAAALDSQVPWKTIMVALYVTSLLILVRNMLRVVEYIQGFSGWIISHEVMLYVFDALLMLIVACVLLYAHPGELLRASETMRLQSLSSGQKVILADEEATTSHEVVPSKWKSAGDKGHAGSLPLHNCSTSSG